jgi:hypothetical protein
MLGVDVRVWPGGAIVKVLLPPRCNEGDRASFPGEPIEANGRMRP